MRRLLAVAIAMIATACSSPEPTKIEFVLKYDDALRLSKLRVEIGEQVNELEAQRTVVIAVPDDWSGKALDVAISGLRDTSIRAHGAATITPLANQRVKGEIVLAELPCGAWCAEGEKACAAAAVVECRRGADGCFEWSEPRACGAAMPSCSLGTCRSECIDECVTGETRCVGPDGIQQCGQADQDSCLDWMAVAPCDAETMCSAGACRTQCVDECTMPATRCLGGGVSRCGDLNLDGCTEWSPAAPCATGICNGGACATSCTNECTENACNGSSWQRCGQFDLDVCRDLSPGTSCTPADPCQTGTCSPMGGCAPVPTVCEMPPDPTCLDATTLRRYADTGSCGAMGCSYATVDTPCPAECVDGACACAQSMCAPQAVATGQYEITDLDMDATHIYWSVVTISTTPTGAVRRRARTLGAPTEELVAGREVAVDDTHVYWVTMDRTKVQRRPKGATGPVELVASGQIADGVVVDATHVYWMHLTDQSWSAGAVMRRLKTLGAAPTETVITGTQYGAPIVLDATHVYTAGNGGSGQDRIVRRSKALGATTTETVVDSANAYILAVDATHVYFEDSAGLKRRSKSLGATTSDLIFAESSSSRPMSVVVEDGYVYWTVDNGGPFDLEDRLDAVLRRSTALGSAPEETLGVVPDAPSFFPVIVDEDAVVWSGYDIAQLSRCACDL